MTRLRDNGSAKLVFAARRKASMTTMASLLPPVVYFMRMRDGLIKIGYTADLNTRRIQLGAKWTDVLAFMPGTLTEEQVEHLRFADHLAWKREYFRPHPELFERINELRAAYNVPPISPEHLTAPISIT